MKDCRDIRMLLDAFADNELSSSEAAGVQQHVEACAACREALEDLLRLKQALRELPRPEASSALRQRIVQRLRQEARGLPVALGGRRRRRVATGLAAGLAAAVALGVVLWQTGAFVGADPMYEAMLTDHHRPLSASAPADMMTSDRPALWSWLNDRISFALPPSLVSRTKLALLGGRVLTMDGEEVAAVQYVQGDERVSLFAMASHGPMPPSARKHVFKGHALFADTYHGYNMLLWQENGVLVCAVSTLARGDLMERLFDVPPEGLLEV